jgi:RNA polymerase sigma factor (sigma-70 family)
MVMIAEFDRLMAEVAAGSEDAVWQLAETYTPYIIRAVRSSLPRTLRAKLDSQDFAQSLWASLLLRRADLIRLQTPGQLIAYLAQATRNKVVDKTRHFHTQKNDIAREERLPDHLANVKHAPVRVERSALYARDLSPSTSANLRERWSQILSKLSDRDRKIFQLRLEGRTFDEISEKLEINQATARRAIQRLIEQLSDEP